MGCDEKRTYIGAGSGRWIYDRAYTRFDSNSTFRASRSTRFKKTRRRLLRTIPDKKNHFIVAIISRHAQSLSNVNVSFPSTKLVMPLTSSRNRSRLQEFLVQLCRQRFNIIDGIRYCF